MPRDLLARVAALLLRKDSKSSYVIEGEKSCWARAIGEALLVLAGPAPEARSSAFRIRRVSP